ncbi:MAG TPA: hypothetical protein VIV35_08975 [Chitinophagaceae bacterium]
MYLVTNEHRLFINSISFRFISGIDKWEKDTRDMVKQSDYQLLDGTFHKDEELPGRNMAEIPHSLVEESMDLFNKFGAWEKKDLVYPN